MTGSGGGNGGPKTAAAFGLPLGLIACFFGLLGLPGGLVGFALGLGYGVLGVLLFPTTVGIARLESWGRILGMVSFCGLAILYVSSSVVWGFLGLLDMFVIATLFGCGLYLLFSPEFESSSSRNVSRTHRVNR